MTYSLFGFALRSELPLPALTAAPAGTGEDAVEVRFGGVPEPQRDRLWSESGDLLFDVPGVGRYRVSGGRRIVIDPAPGASERNLRVYLLGSAMGALLHQRGLLPLHANAVEIGGKAVAFAGRSGAGKSTLAAWFADRGHRVLCDDVCAIGFAEDGSPLVLPGVPRLRLWEDALEFSGRHSSGYERSFDGQDKYDVPAAGAAPASPLLLGACYMLGEAGQSGPAEIERLSGSVAVDALVSNTYRGRFLRLIGESERHFRLCLALAASVPVYVARRRLGRDLFVVEAQRLAAHAEQNSR